MIDPEEDDEVYYENWDFFQVVYEFLIRFLVATAWLEKKQVLRNYIDMRFVTGILDLFDSEDSR